MINIEELKSFLDEKHDRYNTPAFIETDPIQVPHLFEQTLDIEISAFLTSVIAWGKRSTIIANAKRLMLFMDNSPYEFVMNAGKSELKKLSGFVHRTFNSDDLLFFIQSLRNIYLNHGGLKNVFEDQFTDIRTSLIRFRQIFFGIEHTTHCTKHIPNVLENSAAKRMNLFLMWMVRNDKRGVHFGIWNKIKPSELLLPLDVHTATVGRKLGILKRKQNDWLAVEEITAALRKFDVHDPVKYDFALFGLGVFEKF
jgi:uncharacterized protein (TIGR02757 family)